MWLSFPGSRLYVQIFVAVAICTNMESELILAIVRNIAQSVC